MLIFKMMTNNQKHLNNPIKRPSKPKPKLTPRQCEALYLAALGLTNKGIARKMVITPDTVKKHLHDARTALNATNRTHAVFIAASTGLISAHY